MTRRRPANGPRAAVGQILALALIPGAAALLLLLAARNFAPSVTAGGLAGSAIGGWSLRGTPAAFGEIVLGFDLAAQANLTAPALVVRSALNSAILIALAWGLAIGSAIPVGILAGTARAPQPSRCAQGGRRCRRRVSGFLRRILAPGGRGRDGGPRGPSPTRAQGVVTTAALAFETRRLRSEKAPWRVTRASQDFRDAPLRPRSTGGGPPERASRPRALQTRARDHHPVFLQMRP